MSDRKTRADIDRQVEMLAKAYRKAGIDAEVRLDVENVGAGNHYRLQVGGFAVTEWCQRSHAQVWEALLDMRRAVEALVQIRETQQ